MADWKSTTPEINSCLDETSQALSISGSANSSQAASEGSPLLTGYELVADMMNRQDAVIVQIDELNVRIEAAIESLSMARKAEQDEAADASDSNSDSEELPVKKAA